MEDTNARVPVPPEAEPVEPNDAASPAEAPAQAQAPAEATDVAGAERRLLGAIAGRRQLAAHVYGRYGWQLATPGDAGPAQLFGQAQPLIVAAPRIPARSPFMSVVGAAEQMVRTDSQGMAGAHERVDGTWAPEELFWWHRLSPASRMLGQRHGAPPPVRAHVPPPEPPEHPIVRGDPVPAPPPIMPGAPAMPIAPRPPATQEKSPNGDPFAAADAGERGASAAPDVTAGAASPNGSAASLDVPHTETAASSVPDVYPDAVAVTAQDAAAPEASSASLPMMAGEAQSPEAAAPSDAVPAPAPGPSVVSTVVAAATSLWQRLRFVTPPANRRSSEQPSSPLAAQSPVALQRPAAVPPSPQSAVVASTPVSGVAEAPQVMPPADAPRERTEAPSVAPPPLASVVIAPLASSEGTAQPGPTGVQSVAAAPAAPVLPLEPRSAEQPPVESTPVARQAVAPEGTPLAAMGVPPVPEVEALVNTETESLPLAEENLPSSAERLVVTPDEISTELPDFTHAPRWTGAGASESGTSETDRAAQPVVGELARPPATQDTAAPAAGHVAAPDPEVAAALVPAGAAAGALVVPAGRLPDTAPGAAAQPEAAQPVGTSLPTQPGEPDALPSTPVLVAIRDALGAAWRQVQLVVAPPAERGRRIAPAAQAAPAAREISAAPPATAARATAPGPPIGAAATAPGPVPVTATSAVVPGAGTVGAASSIPAPHTPTVPAASASLGVTPAPAPAPAPAPEPMSTASRWRSVPGDFTPPADLVAPLAAMLARQHTASDSDEWGSIPTVGYVVRRAPASPDERASDAHGASLPGSIGPETAHEAEAPSFGELPAQLETLGDEDLARLIMSLPPAMASRAISAGLLDGPEAPAPPALPELTLSPAARPSSRVQEGSLWGEATASRAPSTRLGTERVFAPALARRGSSADQRGGAAGAVTFGSDGSMNTGESGVGAGGDGGAGGGTRQAVASGVNGASATGAMPGISRAPLDRATSSDGPGSADEPGGEMTAPDETPADEEPAEEPDLDRLADEVFDILRWRLVSERERAFR